ncbi:uncharacterized protein LOC116214702 isoform X1 [Punica granatum]|uniref:Uncharacterized protein LOC116214702 isoform X1 n=1 Tax=Punica granatum TaxID=22663 RepID=A0A6P8EHR2_PUNGR|nr:uncharacterized protein LOC116214702 isoform X1 [Punica granatum]
MEIDILLLERHTSPRVRTMGVFFHDDDEDPSNPSKRCRCLISSALREAFSHCRTFNRRLALPSPEEDDYPMSDLDDEEEVVVSEIRTRAMEKLRKKPNFTTDTFSCVFSPSTGEEEFSQKEGVDGEEQEKEEFTSVRSCFTCCSNDTSKEAFISVKTNFSRCSSFNELEFLDLRRRSIIQEFCHCEGWPFGLCRKLLLLPPLPKSPSESWSWRRGKKTKRISPYV